MVRRLIPVVVLGMAAGLALPPAVAQQQQAKPLRVSATAAPAQAAFDALLRQCRDAFEARPLSEVAYAPAREGWVKRIYAPAEIAAAMHPTPSPVTPFVAQITVVELASAQAGTDFDSTREMEVPMDRNLLRSEGRLHLAFQEGRWRLLGLQRTLQVKTDPASEFETVRAARLEPQAAMQLEGPLASCIVAAR